MSTKELYNVPPEVHEYLLKSTPAILTCFILSLCRGKIILGYSEIELCMRGSGYQFVHAADMMHCADNHLRSRLTFSALFPQ